MLNYERPQVPQDSSPEPEGKVEPTTAIARRNNGDNKPSWHMCTDVDGFSSWCYLSPPSSSIVTPRKVTRSAPSTAPSASKAFKRPAAAPPAPDVAPFSDADLVAAAGRLDPLPSGGHAIAKRARKGDSSSESDDDDDDKEKHDDEPAADDDEVKPKDCTYAV